LLATSFHLHACGGRTCCRGRSAQRYMLHFTATRVEDTLELISRIKRAGARLLLQHQQNRPFAAFATTSENAQACFRVFADLSPPCYICVYFLSLIISISPTTPLFFVPVNRAFVDSYHFHSLRYPHVTGREGERQERESGGGKNTMQA